MNESLRPELREVVLHGHRITYLTAGERGPVIVLLHGMTGSSETWRAVIPPLAAKYTVIAPDLPGHGASDKPRADYSLGAQACAVRDLLDALGHDGCTIVGHSLGGGIAMQFAYQFPERCERMGLVSSGGLGHEVAPVLRAAALPGAEYVLPLLANRHFATVATALFRKLDEAGLRADPELEEVVRGYASLSDRGGRRAFLRSVQSVIDRRGQRVSAHNRLYLSEEVPSLIVWGANDHIIPAAHGEAAHAAMPGSQMVIFEHAGHFPHVGDPRRFADLLDDFISTTEPARFDERRHRERLLGG